MLLAPRDGSAALATSWQRVWLSEDIWSGAPVSAAGAPLHAAAPDVAPITATVAMGRLNKTHPSDGIFSEIHTEAVFTQRPTTPCRSERRGRHAGPPQRTAA